MQNISDEIVKNIKELRSCGQNIKFRPMKAGMTNSSFLFEFAGKKYVIRINGAGTEELIDRQNEAAVYKTIAGYGLSDKVICLNDEEGYKVTEFVEGARNCDPHNFSEVKLCMGKLKQFHDLRITTANTFDLFRQINFYESLWGGCSSKYSDYLQVKQKVFSLKNFINKYSEVKTLTHIDAVPDNFLIVDDNKVIIIDWEYAGMCDPHLDLAMFAVYAAYDKQQTDTLIDLYFDNNCLGHIRTKIYCYVAASGLLWSNWCEYKMQCGIDFGAYAVQQYQWAKDYYEIAHNLIEKQ